MSNLTTLELSAEGKVRPVALTVKVYSDKGEWTGETETHNLEIVEMDYLSQEKFMDQQRRRLGKDASGEVEVKNFEGMRMELLQKAVRFADSGKMVDNAFFAKYKVPGTTLQKLYEACQELNEQTRSVPAIVAAYAKALAAMAKSGELTEELRGRIRVAVETPEEVGE